MQKSLRILIIDNNVDLWSWGAPNLVRCSLATAPVGSQVFVHRSTGLPDVEKKFDRIIISGSAASCLKETDWSIALDHFLSAHMDKHTKILGVCYGQQALARVIAKRNNLDPYHVQSPVLGLSALPEVGWTKIKVKAHGELFRGFENIKSVKVNSSGELEFYTYSYHFEEVKQVLGSDADILANSDRCAIQSFQAPELNVYAIQFHPEYNLKAAELSFKEAKEKKGVELLEEGRGSDLYSEEIGAAIFRNFLT